MLLATGDLRTDYEVLGLVHGSSMRAVNLGKDFMAFLRKLVGGNVKEYAALLEDARREALERMVQRAEDLGANAVIYVRFSSSTITTGAAEIIAYGTAVKI
ncbi:MAG: YbjQ family protein [Clostridia bacterium]|nr:MAG: YbjQ family protein [Clostridia bacterium]